jgi:hypothetical protein
MEDRSLRSEWGACEYVPSTETKTDQASCVVRNRCWMGAPGGGERVHTMCTRALEVSVLRTASWLSRTASDRSLRPDTGILILCVAAAMYDHVLVSWLT